LQNGFFRSPVQSKFFFEVLEINFGTSNALVLAEGAENGAEVARLLKINYCGGEE